MSLEDNLKSFGWIKYDNFYRKYEDVTGDNEDILCYECTLDNYTLCIELIKVEDKSYSKSSLPGRDYALKNLDSPVTAEKVEEELKKLKQELNKI